ncbi:Hpt domain-containing protein [Chromobacterium phragmitis]|uniref:Hpt domain-containing protein n=1 Tax=Chromobacterium amazonense TaxID=1382803 RepID=UPI0021B74691|nr:Hpt domain-containing protein [Chromobacterium amazonense]MBM2883315.1 Hpt domain-containing protein [Chromobacterium amazonense]
MARIWRWPALLGMALLIALERYRMDRMCEGANNANINAVPSLKILGELRRNFQEISVQAGRLDYGADTFERNPAEEASSEAEEEGWLDPQALAAIRDIDAGLLPRMVAAWLAEGPLLLAAIHQAANSGDGKELFRAAHALKNGAGSVGAKRLVELCRLLEQLGKAEDLVDAASLVEDLDQVFYHSQEALKALREE